MIAYLEDLKQVRMVLKEPHVICNHDDRRQFTLCNGSEEVRAWVCQYCGAEGIVD